MRLLFVINPYSGGKKKADPEVWIRNYFAGRQEEISFFHLESTQQDLSACIKKWRPDRVIAVGGDGTVKLVAEQLLNTGIPIGILPAGSANGMAAELHLPNNWEQVLELITGPSCIKEIDVINISTNNTASHICIHLSDMGLNALLVKNFEQRGIRGKLGYALSALKTFMRRRLLEVEIRNGRFLISRKAYMVVLANARMYGTGACINPDGNLSDGQFEVVILRKLSIPELFKMLFRHRPFDPQKTEVFQARQVSIISRKKAHFQVDGEYLGKSRQVIAAILPQALKMIVPPPDNQN